MAMSNGVLALESLDFVLSNLLVDFASTPSDYPRWLKRARTFICDTDGWNF
jgi:hypothetical protein